MRQAKTRKLAEVDYGKGTIPEDYRCDNCGAYGVKLWLNHHLFKGRSELRCVTCAAKDQNENIAMSLVGADGKHWNKQGYKTDRIGLYLPAVPMKGRNAFWSYILIPPAGMNWWRNLPTRL